MSSKISQFFNPNEHLVFHQDKDGAMIGGGYRVNNLLYQHKMPLFVSVGGGGDGGGSQMGGGSGREQECSTDTHFIPEKFSDLFRDLAIPAGLFMMPPMFRPRNYAFEVPDADTETEERKIRKDDREGGDDRDDDRDDDDDDDDDERKNNNATKHAPDDIFDTLLSLVEAKERIHHDVKTRRSQRTNTRKNTTKRRKMK